MTMIERHGSAYAAPGAPSRTPRTTEYDAVARITARLKSASGADRARPRELAAALHENRRLWSVLAADVAEPANGLPEQLRAQILYLAKFTFHHSSKVLAGTAGPEPLIEINTSILRGLRGGEVAA